MKQAQKDPNQDYHFVQNGENFTQTTYNGFQILVRDSDGYINASKMLIQINKLTGKNKRFWELSKTKDYVEYCNILQDYMKTDISYTQSEQIIADRCRQQSAPADTNEQDTQSEQIIADRRRIYVAPADTNEQDTSLQLVYELKQDYQANVSGTYVHKMLINYIAQWADKRYSIKVAHIMNLINDNIKNNKIQEYERIIQDKETLLQKKDALLQDKEALLQKKDEQLQIKDLIHEQQILTVIEKVLEDQCIEFIYSLVNDDLPGVVKHGFTRVDECETRLKQINSPSSNYMNINGRQLKSKWYKLNHLNVVHGQRSEAILFQMKNDKRLYSDRELFRYDKEDDLMKDLEAAKQLDMQGDYIIAKEESVSQGASQGTSQSATEGVSQSVPENVEETGKVPHDLSKVSHVNVPNKPSIVLRSSSKERTHSPKIRCHSPKHGVVPVDIPEPLDTIKPLPSQDLIEPSKRLHGNAKKTFTQYDLGVIAMYDKYFQYNKTPPKRSEPIIGNHFDKLKYGQNAHIKEYLEKKYNVKIEISRKNTTNTDDDKIRLCKEWYDINKRLPTRSEEYDDWKIGAFVANLRTKQRNDFKKQIEDIFKCQIVSQQKKPSEE